MANDFEERLRQATGAGTTINQLMNGGRSDRGRQERGCNSQERANVQRYYRKINLMINECFEVARKIAREINLSVLEYPATGVQSNVVNQRTFHAQIPAAIPHPPPRGHLLLPPPVTIGTLSVALDDAGQVTITVSADHKPSAPDAVAIPAQHVEQRDIQDGFCKLFSLMGR